MSIFNKTLTKEEHCENLKKIREFLQKGFPEYEIEIEQVEFFYDATLKFHLKGKYKKL